MEPQVITKVERQKRGTKRYNIFLDEEFAFSVHEDILIKYRLMKGESIKANELALILEEDEFHKAYVTAIRFLSVRPRSVKEVRMRLKRSGHEPELMERIIVRLNQEGYLNDASFAQLTVEHRIRYQKKGRLWVKQELQEKGVATDRIAEAIERIDPEEEERLAYELAEKRWSQTNGDPEARRRKLLAFLMRRGYPGSTVQRVMKKLRARGLTEGEDEIEDLELE